jgi:hypothetical protein
MQLLIIRICLVLPLFSILFLITVTQIVLPYAFQLRLAESRYLLLFA